MICEDFRSKHVISPEALKLTNKTGFIPFKNKLLQASV
jgi:hypothetical protein